MTVSILSRFSQPFILLLNQADSRPWPPYYWYSIPVRYNVKPNNPEQLKLEIQLMTREEERLQPTGICNEESRNAWAVENTLTAYSTTSTD